ncbi:MAG: hypothetical protein J6Y43_04200 [Clostridia bacterium]|nr:hypothetical protein [Clostridia bacterium]
MFYLIIILSASVILGAINCIFVAPVYDLTVWQVAFYVSVSVVAAIAIDGLFAAIVRWLLPEKWFSVRKKLWAAGRKESRFYEKIGIKKWKDKVIELGVFTGFRKNRIADPNNNEYVKRYITEANYGVGCHITGVLCGYLVCLIFPEYWLSVGLPVGIINMILNGLSLMILRYNLPKLHTLYRINLKREKRRQTAESTASEGSGGTDDMEEAPSAIACT